MILARRILRVVLAGTALAAAKINKDTVFKRQYAGCNPRDGLCTCFERKSNEQGKQLFVDCANLGLTEVPFDLPEKTNFLFLNGNNIKRIGVTSFQTRFNTSMTQLRKLYLHNNRRLQKIEGGSLRGMRHLKTLLLHYTNISHIREDTFGYLPNLRTLWFHNAHVKTVAPGAFENLTRLEYLTLNDNHIRSITGRDAIRWPATLEDVNLMRNSFTLNETDAACCAFCGIPVGSDVDAENIFANSQLKCGCGDDVEEIVCEDSCTFDGSKCFAWDLSPAHLLRAKLAFSLACALGAMLMLH